MPAVTTVAVGAASVAAGAIGASKTRKANEKAQKRSIKNEKDRREVAAQELEKATANYNKLREQRPGLTVKDFLSERADDLTGPEADAVRLAIQNGKDEDFARAQAVADAASTGNIKSFDTILDAVSGGSAAEVLRVRSENALGTNEVDAFNRALELRSTAIPAGTVRQDSEGRFVEGQRADKQAFQFAFETQEALRDKQFGKLNTILDSDRSLAQRQQAKAADFLGFTNSNDVLANLTGQGAGRLDVFQANDEQQQINQINSFTQAAFSDQTQKVTPQSTASSDALVGKGFDLALKGLSGIQAERAAVRRHPDGTKIVTAKQVF